jgi:hypothetical protein
MGTVYLARKNGSVVHHTDIKAMGDIDGVEPEKQVTDTEFEAAGGLVRIISDEIFIGKTDEEKATEKHQALVEAAKAKQNELFANTVDRVCNAAHWEDMGETMKEAWKEYRRLLSDIDRQAGYPETINWPIPPEE